MDKSDKITDLFHTISFNISIFTTIVSFVFFGVYGLLSCSPDNYFNVTNLAFCIPIIILNFTGLLPIFIFIITYICVFVIIFIIYHITIYLNDIMKKNIVINPPEFNIL